MSYQTRVMYKCRNASCNAPAKYGFACCTLECRARVPTCNVDDCKNATEPGIYKGINWYSNKCYQHGGRIEYDGEPQLTMVRHKLTYANVKGQWIQL